MLQAERGNFTGSLINIQPPSHASPGHSVENVRSLVQDDSEISLTLRLMTKHWLKDGEAAVLRAQVRAQSEEDAGRKNPKPVLTYSTSVAFICATSQIWNMRHGRNYFRNIKNSVLIILPWRIHLHTPWIQRIYTFDGFLQQASPAIFSEIFSSYINYVASDTCLVRKIIRFKTIYRGTGTIFFKCYIKHRKHKHHQGNIIIHLDVTVFCNVGFYYMWAYYKW